MKSYWIEQVKRRQMAKYMENVTEPKQGNMNEIEEEKDKLGTVKPKFRTTFLVENQRLINEQMKSQASDPIAIFNDEWLNAIYNRVSIAAVKKIYDPANFLVDNLISVQPMSSPGGTVKFLRFRYSASMKTCDTLDANGNICRHYADDSKDISCVDGKNLNIPYSEKDAPVDLPEISLVIESEDCLAKTRRMKTVFPVMKQPAEVEGLRQYYDKFYLTKDFSEKYPESKEFMEDEMASYMATSLTNEIQAEILTDLRNNPGTVATWDFATALGKNLGELYESFYIKIVEVSGIIHRKTLRGGCNWIVTSPELAKIFTDATSAWSSWAERDQNNSELMYHGTMNNRWKLYSSKTAIPRDVILLGYKGDSIYDAGYFYNPYIPLTPIEKGEQIGTLSRYSKKLLREGAKFYGKIIVKGF